MAAQVLWPLLVLQLLCALRPTACVLHTDLFKGNHALVGAAGGASAGAPCWTLPPPWSVLGSMASPLCCTCLVCQQAAWLWMCKVAGLLQGGVKPATHRKGPSLNKSQPNRPVLQRRACMHAGP